MQKYKSNITTTSGAAVRGVPVLVIKEDGNNAALFLDRAGTVPAPNPLTTGADGTFYFYAINGRYSLRTTVEGVTIADDDVVLMMDPEEITVAGPIAEAVAAAQAAAIAAEFAVEASGIPDLVAAAQNAVVDANNAISLSATSANNAAISKTGADSARDAAVIAKNAAEAALDSFDDRYLGAKSVAPTTDNDGGALLTGALYWDTALPGMRSWNGGAWVTLPAATKASVGLANVDNTSDAAKSVLSATKLTTARTINGVSFDGSANISINAAAISNTPAGSIAATTVQGAINELAEIKVDLAAATGASLVGFQQAGTGAVSTTVQSKLREAVSVWDFYANGVSGPKVDPTGVIDSTLGVQAAITASNSVYFPAGTYLISNVTLRANTKLWGDGAASILKQTLTSTFGMLQCDSGSSSVANNITGIVLRDLQLRGTVDTDGFSEFVYLLGLNGVSDVIIENVTFKGFRGDGFYLGSSFTAAIERHNQNIIVRDCLFDGINNQNRNGISIIDGDGVLITGCSFKNMTKSNMPGAIDMEPNADAFPIVRNITIRDNTFANIGGNVGAICAHIPAAVTTLFHNITIDNNLITGYVGSGRAVSLNTNRALGAGSDNNQIKIINNLASGGAAALGLFALKDVHVAANTFVDMSGAGYIGYDTAASAVLDVTLLNNVFRRCGSASPGIGISVGTASHLNIKGNKFIDCGTGAVGAAIAIDFSAGSSSFVSLVDNSFLAPGAKTLVAIQKEAAHTFTAATNTFSANVLNGLSNAFQWGRGDTKQAWLPVVVGGTTAGTCTYSFRKGSYLRVGNVVHFSMSVGWTGHTGTGQIAVSLPVAPSTDVNLSAVSLVVENVGYSAGGTPCALVNTSGGGFMAVWQQSVGGALSAVGLSPASGLYISGSYMVD